MRQLSLFLLFAVLLPAQEIAGLSGINGVVKDPTGSVVPNATVRISNESRGIERRLQTNESGVFSAAALPPAPGYAIRVEAPGFSTFEARDIQLLVGQNFTLNVDLSVGTGVTEIQVTDRLPVVDATKTAFSENVTQDQITQLPINGRRVDSFVLLTAGTVSDGTFGLISFRGNPGGNTFLTDGNDTSNQYYGENSGRTRILSQISQDAVQEFEVLNTGYSAEFGRATGGVVNTVTRSGGNDVRGTAFWFFRNRTLNAQDRYAAFNPPEYRHQAGGSVGGPIVKDKLFFFVNGEVTRRNFPVASSLFRAGVVENRQFVGCTAAPSQCAGIQSLLQPFFAQIPREQNQETAFARIDWRPSEFHTLSASFNYMRFISPAGIQTAAALTTGAALTSNGISTVRDRYGRLEHTWVVSPTALNNFRFGWFKDRQADELGGYAPAFGPISLSVGGAALGIANYLPRVNPSEQRFQFADTFTWNKDKHIIKAGVDFANTEDYISNLLNRFGSYTYGSVTAFAQDYPPGAGSGRNYQTYTQAFGNPVSDFHTKDLAFFLQDQWKVTPSLTLNLGARYEYSRLPQPGVSNPLYPQTSRIPEDTNNIAPRVGLAYRFDRSRTVLRIGYGLSYARYLGGMLNTLLTNNNVYTRQVTINNNPASPNLAGPVFPNVLPNSDLPGGLTSITFAAPNLRTPYTQNGDFAIDQELARDLSLTLSYIWSRGVQFFSVRDLNIGPAGPDATYTIQNLAGMTVGAFTTPTFLAANRVDPRFLRINQVENGGRTYYDGLALQLNKRFSRGYQASVAYTWSHAIDTGLGGGGDNVFFSSGPNTVYPGNYGFERGSSLLDQRHRAVISFIAEPRFTRSNGLLARTLINGWQLSSVTTVGSQFQDTPMILVSGTPIPGAAFSGNLNGYGGSNRVPFLPRTSVPIDLVHRVDARIAKSFAIREHMALRLMFEAFNVTNTQYNTSVDNRAYTVGSDRILRPNPALGTGIASAGFPDGTNARRAQVAARFDF